jgi:predicted TIM-barrel enzyme
MANYKETFPNPHTVLPVVHVESERQALRNTYMANKEGADGVFLIDMHQGPVNEQLNIHAGVRKEFGNWFVGINILNLEIADTFRILNSGISGVWTDRAQIHEFKGVQHEAEEIKRQREESEWKGLYFGGVAFKYQKPVFDVEAAARNAIPYMDVVTTSGTETGSAPETEKIRKMKTAIGDKPLAISSGVSIENIENFKPIADCFLVASSLLVPGTQDFDPYRIRELVHKVRA